MQGAGNVRLYGGSPFPFLERLQVEKHPFFQLFVAKAFSKAGALERRADHLAGIIRGGIDNAGVRHAVVFPPDLFRLDIEGGKQGAILPEGLETVAFQHRLEGVADLMADIPQGSIHFFQFRFRIPFLRVRTVAQAEVRFQLPAGGHGTAVLVGVTDLFPLLVHADTDDMDVGIVGVGMFVGDVRLVSIAHLPHIPAGQFRQLVVGQLVFRCRGERDMQDGLLRVAVCQQVVLEREQCQTYVFAWQSQPVGNHAVPRKNPRRPGRHLVMVVGQCPVQAGAMTYLCNHFRSYSWVSAVIFLQRSISSTLSFSSL